jgi:lactate dehydrogenase-like 2-hydroxyacid dehydrogenase
MKTHSISVAQHALTLVLILLRRILASAQLLREGKWRQDLEGTSYSKVPKKVGIVGLGRTGRWMGNRAPSSWRQRGLLRQRGDSTRDRPGKR